MVLPVGNKERKNFEIDVIDLHDKTLKLSFQEVVLFVCNSLCQLTALCLQRD